VIPVNDDPRPVFPPDFVWGVATAAYQIEGAAAVDGRGECIWDRFSAMPGKVRNGESGAVAADSYHRYGEDIALMRALGVDAYRFSISWPRIVPGGRGGVSAAGLDHYDRLVDALLEAGITPFATLYHWDLPQALEEEGGWTSRATAEAFVDYVEAVAGRLGDRVRAWATHNEPYCSAWLGYGTGSKAPGRARLDDAVAAMHHILLSHGWAVDALRRATKDADVGIVIDSWPVHPATLEAADVLAARQVDAQRNRWVFEPLLRGSYPVDLLDAFSPVTPPVRDGDMAVIAAEIDFLGVNNYSRTIVRASPEDGRPETVRPPSDAPVTDMGWEIYPDGLHEVLTRLHREYAAPPLYVTENGAAFGDVRGHDGAVHDPERIAYLDAYIRSVGRAIADDVPVRGYFAWSLLDNFEWEQGYWRRFGLVYVDYPTLERVRKDSFAWYRGLIASARTGSLDRAAA
jgi:beta-glucosidase